jgi:hypothetical protein
MISDQTTSLAVEVLQTPVLGTVDESSLGAARGVL